MMKMRSSVLFVLILFVSMFVFWGCPKKAEVTTTPEAQVEEPSAADAEQARRDREAMDAKRRAEEDAEARERAAAAGEGLQTVYFDFDKAFIRDDARAVLKANAAWLKANPKAKVRLEGNTDERGTNEYNQALGQRRAASTKKYLTDLGIAASRMSLISYGEEKSVCNSSDEDCWQKNRRTDFKVE